MPTQAPGQFWIVRKPDAQGTIVARFDTFGETLIADEVADYPGFTIQEVAVRSALADKTVDPSVLTDDERERLGYPD